MDYRLYQDCLKKLEEYHPDSGSSSVREKPLPESGDQSRILDIIVPAYNVENYIKDCIDSILKQKTHYSYKVIIVDDGSTDYTGAVVDKYRTRKEVFVIHQKNKGLSAARNAGLEQSTSKYVMFVDSDDCLPPHAVEKLLITAEKEDADLVQGSYQNFKQFRWLKKIYVQKEGLIYNDFDLKGHAWAKIFRRTLFEKVQFPEKYLFEDSLMHQIIYPYATKKWGIGDVVYERRINLNSITHTSQGNPKSIDSLWVTLRLMDDRQKLGMPVTIEYYDYILDQTILTHTRLGELNPEIQKCAFYVMCYHINNFLPGFKTERKTMTVIEKSVRSVDFDTFTTRIKEKKEKRKV